MTSSPERAAAPWLPVFDESAPPEPRPDGAWTPAAMADAKLAGPLGAMRARIDEVHQRGYDAGVRDGEAFAAQSLAPALTALAGVTQALDEARGRFEAARARNLEGLALAVARRLLQREVEADPAVVRDLIAQALDLLPPEGAVDVHLNPVDLAALAGALEELHAAGRGLTLQWIADPAMERGSFVLETPARIVDGRADVALRTLYERLSDA